MRIRIVKPGLLSTVQDMGRHLYLSQAVPVSGAMDHLSARIANISVGNAENDAVIEFTFGGSEFLTETDVLISYSGEGATLMTGNFIIPPNRPVYISSGKEIRLINNSPGSRTYLAVSGGWDVPEVLGSRSTYITARLGGFSGKALKKGDALANTNTVSTLSDRIFADLKNDFINYPSWSVARDLFLSRERKVIRIIPAKEFPWFNGESIVNFLENPYTIGRQSNRMGYQLEGPKLKRLITNELLSTAVVPGTIQVTNDGTLILLMADCQTTGGYPRIATVAAVDMPLCGQLQPGDQVFFREISHEEAQSLNIDAKKRLNELKIGIESKFDK